MPRTAASIISAAQQIAHVPLYGTQALDEFNSLLRYIEETVDFSAARGQWNFFFNTNLVTSGAGNIIQTAGVPIPIDYLRVQVSGGSTGAQRSSKWYFQGVPYDMIEVDLTEFDDQVQQAGIQSYPVFLDERPGAISADRRNHRRPQLCYFRRRQRRRSQRWWWPHYRRRRAAERRRIGRRRHHHDGSDQQHFAARCRKDAGRDSGGNVYRGRDRPAFGHSSRHDYFVG